MQSAVDHRPTTTTPIHVVTTTYLRDTEETMPNVVIDKLITLKHTCVVMGMLLRRKEDFMPHAVERTHTTNNCRFVVQVILLWEGTALGDRMPNAAAEPATTNIVTCAVEESMLQRRSVVHMQHAVVWPVTIRTHKSVVLVTA